MPFAKIKQWIVIAMAVMGILALTAFRLMSAGAAKERTRQMERRLEDTLKAKEVRDEVASTSPDIIRKRLRDNWSR